MLVNTKTNIVNEHNFLKILTGKRQTSWLFTNVSEELNSGLPKTPPAGGQNKF